MRKLYALLAGLSIVLASSKLSAQTVIPDVANFTIQVQTGNNVSFTNTSVIGNIQGDRKAFWFFGDGTMMVTPPLGNAQHHYNAAGTFTVCLKIYRYFNNHTDSVLTASECKSLTIQQSATCTADFQYQDSVITGPPVAHKVKFSGFGTNSQNRPIAYVCWNFGDGSPQHCIQASSTTTLQQLLQPSHIYTGAGPYTACLRITYQEGCVAEKCKQIQFLNTVHPDSCRANFERINVTATSNPLQATFRALPWHNNNKKPTRICWQFGDGTPDTCIYYAPTYTGPLTVNHTYATAGNYQVCVKIKYEGGCESYKCETVHIVPPQPVCAVSITEITQSINSLTRGFLAIPNTTPYQRPQRVCWYFGDGTDSCIIIDPNQPLPPLTMTHTYPGPGSYTACVKIRYVSGCEAQSCRTVTIQSPNTVCGGYIRDSLVGPRTYLFKGFSIHSPGDNVVTWRWTFGDGTTQLGQNVTHVYAAGGQYNVCLTIVTQMGCESRICKTIHVPGSNIPVLVLTPNPVLNELHAIFQSTQTQPVTVKITNQFGVVVRTYTRNAVQGNNTWAFDVSTLPPGIYTFSVQSSTQLASAIFIKL